MQLFAADPGKGDLAKAGIVIDPVHLALAEGAVAHLLIFPFVQVHRLGRRGVASFELKLGNIPGKAHLARGQNGFSASGRPGLSRGRTGFGLLVAHEFPDKARGLHQDAAMVARGDQAQPVFGPGAAHVKQPPLLLQFRRILVRQAREQPVYAVHQNNLVVFQALGPVDGGQAHRMARLGGPGAHRLQGLHPLKEGGRAA